MEELKDLMNLVKDLPALALWVLVGFWAYKVVVIGSIYGVIRYTLNKFVEWRTFTPPPPPAQPVEYKLAHLVIKDEVALALTAQITRLVKPSYGYLHGEDVIRLRDMIDRYEAERRQAKEAKQ